MQAWSDPSFWDDTDLFETVAIYYFTESFHTSVMIYSQNKDIRAAFRKPASWGKLKSKLGLSAFVSGPFLVSFTSSVIADRSGV